MTTAGLLLLTGGVDPSWTVGCDFRPWRTDAILVGNGGPSAAYLQEPDGAGDNNDEGGHRRGDQEPPGRHVWSLNPSLARSFDKGGECK